MTRKLAIPLLLVLTLAGAARAAGSKPQSPEDRAKKSHNKGLELSERADDQAARGESALARTSYERARESLEQAVQKDTSLHPAWNQLGYVRRKLGDLEGSLTAYDRALELAPGFGQAVEYRAETYLALGRLEDAKAAYLVLFEQDRPLADQLEGAMSRFVVEKNKDPGDLDQMAVLDFTRWVSQRRRIARDTGGSYQRPLGSKY